MGEEDIEFVYRYFVGGTEENYPFSTEIRPMQLQTMSIVTATLIFLVINVIRNQHKNKH